MQLVAMQVFWQFCKPHLSQREKESGLGATITLLLRNLGVVIHLSVGDTVATPMGTIYEGQDLIGHCNILL